jgi:hypothetical protein
MKKDKFLKELLQRAEEQQLVLHDVPFPGVFLFVSKKLGENPWKLVIPIGVTLAIVCHTVLQQSFDERILWLFGGL